MRASVTELASPSYVYDDANQLIWENNQAANKTWTWEYDAAGNILSRRECDYTTDEPGAVLDTVTYTYGDSQWGDLLTNYNGRDFTYDTIGNLTNDGVYTYTWQHGRQLASMSGEGATWQFEYGIDGMRSKRTNGNVTYRYIYNGGQLSCLQISNAGTMYFTYDDRGRPFTVNFNGVTYSYVLNLQGDVVAITDATGKSVLDYSYDAWGKTSGRQNSAEGLALLRYNPLRYRGYVYDTETGLYYLQSRYYNPEIGRFINADAYASTGQGILGNNMFAYCQNNPITYADPTGHSIILTCIIIGAVIGAVAGGAVGAYVSYEQTGEVDGLAVATGVIGGGILGGLAGWGIGAAITTFGLATTGGAAAASAPAIQQTCTALQTYYPPNDGFWGSVEKITLEAGTLIQRTGDLVGRFVAPAGTPQQMLSLPYDKIGQPTTILQIQQSIEVLSGRVAPWFGQMGGGIQYILFDSLDDLLDSGIITIWGG